MIGIITAKSGNIGSIINVLRYLKKKYVFIEKKSQINNINKLILPGVGSFKNLKKNLISLNLFDELKKFILNDKNYFLGICIGMQILLSKGTEEGKENGLNIFEGIVKNFNSVKKVKVPNINWKKLKIKQNCRILRDHDPLNQYYFLHSYFCEIADTKHVIATSDYKGIEFPCIIKKKNIYGIQFHPEKSNLQGLNIVKNFCEL